MMKTGSTTSDSNVSRHSKYAIVVSEVTRTTTLLTTLPNVLVTGHQAYLTEEALTHIAATTRSNLDGWAAGQPSANEL